MEIQAREIAARLGGNQILSGASIRAGQNDFIGVIGPNGSGKSTLLKCIYRVLEPTGGAVYLDDKELSRLPTGSRPSESPCWRSTITTTSSFPSATPAACPGRRSSRHGDDPDITNGMEIISKVELLEGGGAIQFAAGSKRNTAEPSWFPQCFFV